MSNRIEHKIVDGVEMKQCSRCKGVFPLAEYSKDGTKWDGLYGFCKKCASVKDRRYYRVHKDEICKRVLEYEKRTGLSQIYKPYNPKYYSSQKSKEKKLIRDEKRRKIIYLANKKNKITKDVVREVINKYQGKCAYCGIDCLTEYHIDHKKPLYKGGGNELSNLALSCPHCNWSKGKKTDIEYYGINV